MRALRTPGGASSHGRAHLCTQQSHLIKLLVYLTAQLRQSQPVRTNIGKCLGWSKRIHVQMYLVVMAHDNTSGVAGKARLIKNFLQAWCVREQRRRLVRIDEHGRQVRQVWQLEDTAPIMGRAKRRVPVPEGSIFLTFDCAPLWLVRCMPARRLGVRACYHSVPGLASGGRWPSEIV